MFIVKKQHEDMYFESHGQYLMIGLDDLESPL